MPQSAPLRKSSPLLSNTFNFYSNVASKGKNGTNRTNMEHIDVIYRLSKKRQEPELALQGAGMVLFIVV